MGYILMRREDGTMHRQPFLVNTPSADCIMSPDAIAQQVPNCINWSQQGHMETEPGSLEFFNVRGTRILQLCLNKCRGLYYYGLGQGEDKNEAEDQPHNRFTEDWV